MLEEGVPGALVKGINLIPRSSLLALHFEKKSRPLRRAAVVSM